MGVVSAGGARKEPPVGPKGDVWNWSCRHEEACSQRHAMRCFACPCRRKNDISTAAALPRLIRRCHHDRPVTAVAAVFLHCDTDRVEMLFCSRPFGQLFFSRQMQRREGVRPPVAATDDRKCADEAVANRLSRFTHQVLGGWGDGSEPTGAAGRTRRQPLSLQRWRHQRWEGSRFWMRDAVLRRTSGRWEGGVGWWRVQAVGASSGVAGVRGDDLQARRVEEREKRQQNVAPV